MCKNKKFNLLVLIPNSGMSTMTLADRKQMLSKYADDNTEISVECIPAGPISIETEHEEFEAGIHILNRARTAAEDGFDCMIVYCSSDPAVRAARELAKIPVIGPGYISMMIGQELGDQYSIITPLKEMININNVKLRGYGFDPTKCKSIRSLDINVDNLRDAIDETYKALLREGEKCILEDGAHVIVLACLGLAGLGERLQADLHVPVIDPASVSIKYAELLYNLGLNYSSLSYEVEAY